VGVPRRGFSLLGGSPVFSAPLARNFECIIRVLSSSPVDCHSFRTNWEVCGHFQISEAHALGSRPRGESSQWSSNSL